MSNAALTWAFGQNITAANGKFVLVALADFADEQASCYPGQDRLAQMTGQSARNVRRQLALLEGKALIRREPRFARTGHRTSDRYYLAMTTSVATGQNDLRSPNPQPPDNPGPTTGQDARVTISNNLQSKPAEQRIDNSADGTSFEAITEQQTPGPPGKQFDEFWNECRRKVDRKRCQAAWTAAVKRGADPAHLIAAMRAYTAATADRDTTKVKQPLTWLSGENWNDDLRAVATQRRGALASPMPADDTTWNDPSINRF